MNAKPHPDLCSGLYAALAVALAAGLVYAPTLTQGFAFDEYFLILEDTTLHSLRYLPDFFTRPFWPGQTGIIYYRPLITLTYALDYTLGQGRPWPFHLTNLIGHVLASVLAFRLCRRLFPPLALFTGLLFALHPVHTETVTWISGRTDLFATLFLLLAWLLALPVSRGTACRAPTIKYRSVGRMIFSLAAFALALLAKEAAVVFPLLLFLGDRLQARRLDAGRAGYYFLLFLVLLGYFFLRHHALITPGPEPAPAFFAGHTLGFKLLTMSAVGWTYLRLLFFPFPLRLDYYYDQLFKDGVPTPVGLAALAGLIALALLALASPRRRPGAAFDFLGLALSLLPVSHLISFPTLMAERFLYLPSLFACLFLARMLAALKPRAPRLLLGLSLLLLLEWIGLAAGRNRDWQNGYRFWRAAVREIPERPEGHNLLGIFAMNRGQVRLARHEYEAALRLDPDYTVALSNLAEIAFRQGDLEEARRRLEEAVKKTPDLATARFNLGMVYARLGEEAKAVLQLQAGLELFPANLEMRLKLIELLQRQGRIEEARKVANEGLALTPGQPDLLRLRIELR